MTKIPRINSENNLGNIELQSYLVQLERSLKKLLADIGDISETQVNKRVNSSINIAESTYLKDEIIRVADEIKSVRDSINLTLENNYVAKSEVGVYAENAVQNVELDGKGITQYFKEISLLATRLDDAESSIIDNSSETSELNVRVSEINAYVRTGKLDEGVYGIEIGNFHDGTNSPYKVRLSENRLSFYIGNTEVAYFSDNSMVIANASVLNSLNLGECIITPNDGLTFVCVK